MDEEYNNEEISKSVRRRSQAILVDFLFGDYNENYGKEADAKLLSWQQQKELRKISEEIIKTVNRKRSEFDSDLAVELVSETYYDLIELKEVLKLRMKIAEIIEQSKDFDKKWRTIFAETYDLDLLRGILKALEHDTSEAVIPLLEDILCLSEDYTLYETYIDNLFEYYKVRVECPYKEVLEFLDSYNYEFYTNDGITYITDILGEYSPSKVGLPFSKETQEELERDMPFFVDSGVFEQKNEENLIKLINGIFVWLNKIPQLGELSFQPMVKIERKLTKKENIIQGDFNSNK